MNADELQKILEDHALWLEGKGGAQADLSGADLSRASLSRASLSRASLSEASLDGADLRYASLEGADLEGADLRWAILSGADLNCADLNKANLNFANLRMADLRRADLIGANLEMADLRRADLRWANLRNANLLGALLNSHTVGDGQIVTWTSTYWATSTRDERGVRWLQYGCVALPLSEWRERAKELAEIHEPQKAAYYEAETLALVALCEALDEEAQR